MSSQSHVLIKTIEKKIEGTLSFPGDKSLSHRAIIFGSLAKGQSFFKNILAGEDCVCTRKAFESLGVAIHSPSQDALIIEGRGKDSFKPPASELFLGNSGTSMRLLLGILAGQEFKSVLTGDPSLSSRPMRRVTDHLKKMGAVIEGRDEANYAPLSVCGGHLKGICARLAIPSAQVKSAILLAGLYADTETSVTEPIKSRDHTEKFLSFFGADFKCSGLTTSVRRGREMTSQSFEIPGDISSAAFFMAMALLIPKASLAFKSILWNPTRTGIINVLKRMGVSLIDEKVYSQGPELCADFSLNQTSLKAFEIKKDELPGLIDEIPILTVLATQARGVSVIRDAAELRVKETDRIESMSTMLNRMGAKVTVEKDSLIIEGPTPLRGASTHSFKDHRTAMSLITAGMVAQGDTLVEDVDCINTSFPNFFKLLDYLGIFYRRNGPA